ncbi:MAG: sugar phosphate isomerase/epimerase [Clostridia bacterium]|nr:sugar phosphate isomerase/epimerase [Clostridia bacterium]
MQTGISTASLFGRFFTEDSTALLSRRGVKCTEIFLESFCEYNEQFGQLIASCKGDMAIHSVHTLTTQFESTLYSLNKRAQDDSFAFLESTMQAARAMDAKYFTFHGLARVKRTPYVIDFARCGEITRRVMEVCAKYGVTLAYENVHWAYYNYIGFFSELKKHTTGLKGTLDIKQARQAGIDANEFINEMGEDIVTVHLSDIDENGKMCLPGRGVTDFKDLFTRLRDKGFDGAMLLEVYKNDFSELNELFESLAFVDDLASRIFK